MYSSTRPGTPISDTHHDLLGQVELAFTDQVNAEVDVLFLCLGHGNSSAFLEQHTFSSQTIIIDLSNDFRLNKDAHFGGREFIYGFQKSIVQPLKKRLQSRTLVVLLLRYSWLYSLCECQKN